MTMDAANTWIALNQATTGSGGGIDLNLSTADIGSGGYLFGAAIYNNTAERGGGIAVHDLSHLNLYTTDPMHPVAIDNNTAYDSGGGIYVSNSASMCAANFRLTNNTGKEGSGLYLDGFAFVNPATADSCSLSDFGSVPCDASQPCNIVHGNNALDVKNHNAPTNGATLRIWSGATFIADKLDVRANHGGYAMHVEGNPNLPADRTQAQLTNCLFAENVLTHELMLAYNGTSQVSLMNCTLARDGLGAGEVLSTNDQFDVDDSIIAEGSIPVSLGGIEGNYDLVENFAGLGGLIYPGTPDFIDAEHGDYRLFYGLRGGQFVRSPGIDYAPAVDGDDRDIRDLPRDQAIEDSYYGARDLGAYEMQGAADRIFIDTFGDDVLLVH
jgi:predicted outer membrane repeat protein